MPRCNIDHSLQAGQAQHAGLWLEKYVSTPEDTKQHSLHVRETAAIDEPRPYRSFFDAWRRALSDAGAETRLARCLGRLVVGLGNESVIETSITLHRTYGVPYIPGSALKGLTASYARQRLGEEWQATGMAYRVLFGWAPDTQTARALPAPEAETDAGAAGHVTFFDALYLPGSGLHGHALHPDVMTVHHPGYYNSAQPGAPADWDSPNPVSFLTATGEYLLALAGPPAWVNAALRILAYALAEFGVGAKTNAGYGRMSVAGYETLALLAPAQGSQNGGTQEPRGEAPADPQRALVDGFIRRLTALPAPQVAGQINLLYEQWKAMNVSPAEKKRAAQAIVEKIASAGRERNVRDKSWYQEVLAAARS